MTLQPNFPRVRKLRFHTAEGGSPFMDAKLRKTSNEIELDFALAILFSSQMLLSIGGIIWAAVDFFRAP